MERRVLPRHHHHQQQRNCENGEIIMSAHVRDPRDEENGEFAVNEISWGGEEMRRVSRNPARERRDTENGEVVESNVCVIRRPATPKQRTFRIPNGAVPSRNMSLMPYSLVDEQRRFSGDGNGGFRIHSMIQNGMGLRLRKRGDLVYRRNVDFPPFPMFQTRIQLERGVVVRRTTEPAKPVHPSLGIVERKSNLGGREIFHVPEDSLPPGHFDEMVKDPHTISINIWQEFLYGRSVLKDHMPEQRTRNDWTANKIRLFLGSFIPAAVVNTLLYSAFFVLYFFAACFYNNYVELLTYVLLLDHLKIHERANATNVNVEFSGSMFQGPLYALLRNWCEHCHQKERAKVVTKLMKKMKEDITRGKTRNSKTKIT